MEAVSATAAAEAEAKAAAAGDGVVAGHGYIDGRLVFVFSQDFKRTFSRLKRDERKRTIAVILQLSKGRWPKHERQLRADLGAAAIRLLEAGAVLQRCKKRVLRRRVLRCGRVSKLVPEGLPPLGLRWR